GRDSIRQGIVAAGMGMAFLAIFMILYYRLSGVNAIVALAANLLILLGAMAYTGATLTLPGIAGVILTVGVGVDTNVLVFERIREELRNGKTVKAAINNGFDRVWMTILDTHANALIVAGIAYISSRGVRYGVEFSGGTQLIATFQNRPEVDKVRAAVDKVTSGAVIQTYDEPSKNRVLIRLPHTGGEGDLSSSAD